MVLSPWKGVQPVTCLYAIENEKGDGLSESTHKYGIIKGNGDQIFLLMTFTKHLLGWQMLI